MREVHGDSGRCRELQGGSKGDKGRYAEIYRCLCDTLHLVGAVYEPARGCGSLCGVQEEIWIGLSDAKLVGSNGKVAGGDGMGCGEVWGGMGR